MEDLNPTSDVGGDQPKERRQSRRQRAKSGKKHLNPDFIYENFGEDTQRLRPRSTSWSSTSRAAVVERKISAKGNKHDKHGKHATQDVQDLHGAALGNLNRNVKKGLEDKPSSGFSECQRKLSQTRIDTLFVQPRANTKSKHSWSASNKSGALNKSALNVTVGGQRATSFDAISTTTNTQELEDDSFLCQYGSDCESIVREDQEVSFRFKNGHTNVKQQISDERQLKNNQPAADLNINSDFTMSTMESKEVQTLSYEGAAKKASDEVNDALKVEMASLRNQVKTCQLQMAEMQGVVIRHDIELKECKEGQEISYKHNSRKLLKIGGIVEDEDEDCVALVKNFFKVKLGIKKEIGISDAFRLGTGDERPIRVIMSNPREKGLIFTNTNKLKDVVNENDKPYSVDDQLSAKKLADRNKKRRIWIKNKKKSTADQLKMSFKKGKLTVDGAEYVDSIKPPSCAEILRPTKDERLARLKLKLSKSEPLNVEGQTFIGYSFCPKDIQEVNLAYAKVRSMHSEARHVISSCRLPGRAFHTNQTYFDDDEHNGGAFLLDLLVNSDIQNRALFVARIYDGTHIGGRRFRAMFDVAAEAIDRDPENKITLKRDKIWYVDKNSLATTPVRGRGRGGGGRGFHHKGDRHGNYQQGSGSSLLNYAAAVKSPPIHGILNEHNRHTQQEEVI